jgi:heterodisulfide reductase subunit C
MPERVFNLTREMLDHSFAESVAPDREKLLTCIQCGTCTASCPTAYAMDYTPRQLWRLVQVGLRDEALNSRTFWLCTNCYSCTIRCPRGIALTETMAALKRLAIAEGVKGKDKDNVSAFYRAFVATVRRHGRNHEAELLLRYFLSANPLAALKFARLGAAMFMKGRVPLLAKELEGKKDIETLFTASLAVEKAAAARASAQKAAMQGLKEAEA